eukprot:755042-Pyramimonas_sp.AAC.1
MTTQPPIPSGLRSLIPGVRLYVRCPDEYFWHERFRYGRVLADGWSWVVPTTNEGQHEEDFVDAAENRACGPKGGLPVVLY